MTNWIKATEYAEKHKITRTKVYQDIAFGRIPKGKWKKQVVKKELLLVDADFAPVDNRKSSKKNG